LGIADGWLGVIGLCVRGLGVGGWAFTERAIKAIGIAEVVLSAIRHVNDLFL
jgi:hypothetical protein